jgi:hypothetical protein
VRAALLFLLIAGCGTVDGRLRFVSSQATQATWSFVVDDRARGAEILIDGRFRGDGCDRHGVQLRCELRGMFPGGHTLEVRLPAAVLKRTVLIGRPWAARPAFVTVRDAEEAAAAARASADAVVVDPRALEPEEVIEAAHKHGARALVKNPELVERAGADGLLGVTAAPDLLKRFPEVRSYSVDEKTSEAVTRFAAGGDAAALKQALSQASGLTAGVGLVGGAAALTAEKGALLDAKALAILDGRKRHASLREGKTQDLRVEGARYGVTFVSGSDATTLLINASKEPWHVEPELPISPIDLLGGHPQEGKIDVAPNDVALLVRLPEKDKTHY